MPNVRFIKKNRILFHKQRLLKIDLSSSASFNSDPDFYVRSMFRMRRLHLTRSSSPLRKIKSFLMLSKDPRSGLPLLIFPSTSVILLLIILVKHMARKNIRMCAGSAVSRVWTATLTTSAGRVKTNLRHYCTVCAGTMNRSMKNGSMQ